MTTNSTPLFLHIRDTSDGLRVVGEPNGRRGHQVHNSRRQDIDGVFVEWIWDGERLKLKNDRYGFHPLFYHASATEIAISDSIDALLAAGAPRELDDAGLAAFLRLGHFLGDDTAFRSIRMLAPNADLEWSVGGVTLRSSVVIAQRQELSRDDAMDAYVELFRAAIARRGAPTRPLIVPLSGGRDSRHILLELCRQGYVPDTCATARYLPREEYKTDVEVAARLCAELGIPHYVPPTSNSRKAPEQKKNRQTNYATMEHGWFMPVADYLNAEASVTYDGMAGDVLSAGHFLTRERHEWFERRQFRQLFQDMEALTERAIPVVLSPEAVSRFSRERALERFETECVVHLGAPNPVGSFSIFNRTRRVACLTAYALQPQVEFVFSPFLDNDLFDLLSSLPAEFLVDHNFHTDMIRYAYPEYAHVPFTATQPATGYVSDCRRYAREVVAEVLVSSTSGLLRKSGVLPRLVRCQIDAGYAPSAIWLGDLSIYLTQLEEAAGMHR